MGKKTKVYTRDFTESFTKARADYYLLCSIQTLKNINVNILLSAFICWQFQCYFTCSLSTYIRYVQHRSNTWNDLNA